MPGRHNSYFKLDVHGRIKFYWRPQVLHRWCRRFSAKSVLSTVLLRSSLLSFNMPPVTFFTAEFKWIMANNVFLLCLGTVCFFLYFFYLQFLGFEDGHKADCWKVTSLCLVGLIVLVSSDNRYRRTVQISCFFMTPVFNERPQHFSVFFVVSRTVLSSLNISRRSKSGCLLA